MKINKIENKNKLIENSLKIIPMNYYMRIIESSEPNEFGKIPVKRNNSIDVSWGRVKISLKSTGFIKFWIFRFFTVEGRNSLTGRAGRENSSKFNSNRFNRVNNLEFSKFEEIIFFHPNNSFSEDNPIAEIKNRKFWEKRAKKPKSEKMFESEVEIEFESEEEIEVKKSTKSKHFFEDWDFLK